ncbi:hypothetical protein [Paenibacillus aceris]|uniref:DUF4396 domain-containing protein n=1 Tax=Paenibacillus aceris TaxID=869555 RepID=A0ABS4HVH3_9BACL|nr:hypothetical protein [Paenibacillus aceris]MBP1962647.1 hypothetical protein [Paenibacillus aceris]NHW37455.1 hypothetical protein [Paenibacillus aceris]
MDFYHSPIYLSILNTEWFMWIVVGSVLGINFLAPVIVWYHLKGKQFIQKFKELRRQ